MYGGFLGNCNTLSLLHGRFSEVPAMQVVDSATTMGLLFGAMGVGAFIGPVGFNLFTPPKCALSGHPPTHGHVAGPGARAEV